MSGKKKGLAQLVAQSKKDGLVPRATGSMAFEKALLASLEEFTLDDLARSSAMLGLMEKEIKIRRKAISAQIGEKADQSIKAGNGKMTFSESGRSVSYDASGVSVSVTLPVVNQLDTKALAELFEGKGLPDPMWELALPKSRKPKTADIDALVEEHDLDLSDFWDVSEWVLDDALAEQLIEAGEITREELNACFGEVNTGKAPVVRVTPGATHKQVFKELLEARTQQIEDITEEE